jgi:hypothetical protein
MFIVKRIVFSITPIADHSKRAGAKTRKFWVGITHLRVSDFGIAVTTTRCTLRVGGLSQRPIGAALNFFRDVNWLFTKYPPTSIGPLPQIRE